MLNIDVYIGTVQVLERVYDYLAFN